MKTLTLSYEIKPENNGGFTVECMDWNPVFSEGQTIQECKQNAIEVTQMYLELLKQGKLKPVQMPKIKKHKATPFTFQLTFNYDNCQYLEIENNIIFTDIYPIEM